MGFTPGEVGITWGARVLPALLILFVLMCPSAHGESLSPKADAAFVEQAPTIDGVLDEKVWADATPIPAPAGETRFLWNHEGVYLSYRGFEKTPAMGHAAPGESLHEGDVFELFVDQRGDHRQFYEIQIDPEGRLFLFNHLLTAEPRLTPEGRLEQEFVESELWRHSIPVPVGFRHVSRLNRETGEWTLEVFLPAGFVNRRSRGASMQPTIWRIHLVRNDWDKPKGEPDRKVVSSSWAPVLEFHAHISPTRMGWLELKKPE